MEQLPPMNEDLVYGALSAFSAVAALFLER